MGFHVPSPARAVEVIGGYASAGALGFLYFEWRLVIPQIAADDRASFFLWLNEGLGLMAILIWLWVTAYVFTQGFAFTGHRCGKALSIAIASTFAESIAFTPFHPCFTTCEMR